MTIQQKTTMSPSDFVDEGLTMNFVVPTNLTEIRSACSNTRGEKEEDKYRSVAIRYDATTKGRNPAPKVDVKGPKDGRPLVIDVVSGFITLNVLSGNVIILADSSWGNPINTYGSAEVTVCTKPDRKTTILAYDDSTVTIYNADENGRGMKRAYDNAQLVFG